MAKQGAGVVTQVGRYKVVDSTPVSSTDKNGDPDLPLSEWIEFDLRATVAVFEQGAGVAGPEMKFARKALGLKQTEFARLLGVSAFSVSDWERGASPVTGLMQRMVALLLKETLREGHQVLDRLLEQPRFKPAEKTLRIP